MKWGKVNILILQKIPPGRASQLGSFYMKASLALKLHSNILYIFGKEIQVAGQQ